jgi:probable F420-dependent oxidoreductase
VRSSSDARILPSIRPFRFAIATSRAASGPEWRAKARRVEQLGYDTLLITDHMTAQLAPIPAMTAALDATARLRVGSYVFSNDYRNPVLLAKEIATLDVLSGGRVDFGIGAGWNVRDYQMLGITYDPPATRVPRMMEAVRLIDRLLTEDIVDAKGRYYTIRGAKVLPRPVQRPRPPLMIGAGGPRLLRFAAERADIVVLNPQFNAAGRPMLSELTAAATQRKIDDFRAAAGTRLDGIELSIYVADAGVTDEPRSLFDGLATRLKGAVTQLVDSPFFLYGSVADIVSQLRSRRERYGMSYVGVPERAMESFAAVVRELRGT